MQYDAYSSLPLQQAAAAQTPQQSVKAAVPPPVMGGEQGQIPIVDSKPDISGAPVPPGQQILSREERVEYRDQNGNILNEEQVKALEGKVEFKTRYETRTRVVDAEGNEVPMPAGGWPQESLGVAPPHPDVEGMFLESHDLSS
jgi:dolichyl-phosphate-mannose-protein mannosyltransferase